MDRLISLQAAMDVLEKVAGMYPWRVPGDRDSYSSYNEAWNDALNRAESEIEALPPAQTEINKEELKRTIRAGIVATNTKDVYSCGMRNGMRWCKALLEDDKPKFEDASLYAQPEQRWIPVTEMLPEEEVDVLVAVSHDTVMIAWIDDGQWTSDGVSLLANVKAWMPLHPYKEDEP